MDKAKVLRDRWGQSLAIVGGLLYGVATFIDHLSAEASEASGAKSTAAFLAAVGAWRWLVERNKTDTREAVGNALTFEAMLAGLGLDDRLEKLEADGDRKHAENQQANAAILAAITADKGENQAQHDEHRRRLDEHREWLERLDGGQQKLGEQMDGVAGELNRLTAAIRDNGA